MGEHAPKLHGGRRARPTPKRATARRKKAEPNAPAQPPAEEPTTEQTPEPEQDAGES